MKKIGVIEFRYNKSEDIMHFRLIEGTAHPSAAQMTAARNLMRARGIGKTRFEIFNDDRTIKEL